MADLPWSDYSDFWDVLDPKKMNAFVNESTFNVDTFNEFMYSHDSFPPHLDPLITLRNLFPDGMWDTQAFDERMWDDSKGEPPVKFLSSRPNINKTKFEAIRFVTISQFLFDKYRGIFLKDDFKAFTEIRSEYDLKFKDLPTETTKLFFRLLDLLVNLRKYPINLNPETQSELLEINEIKIEILSKLMNLDTETRDLLDTEKQKVIQFFERVIDLPAFWSDDHERIRDFFIDWYTSVRTISTRIRNSSDVFTLSQQELDEMIKSFGFPYPWDVEKKRKATFLQNLLSLYKYKGTPRAFITALNYLSIDDVTLYEWYIDRIDETSIGESYNLDDKEDLKRYKEKVRFFALGKPIYPEEKSNNEEYHRIISYEEFIKFNPFWQMNKDQDGNLTDDDPDSIYKLYYNTDLSLPSLTSVVTVDSDIKLGNYPADKSILRRKMQEEYEYWMRNILIKNGPGFTARKVLRVIQSWNELNPNYIPEYVFEKALEENFRVADWVELIEYVDSTTGESWFSPNPVYTENYEYITENNKYSEIVKEALFLSGRAVNVIRDAKVGDLVLVDPDSDDQYFEFRNNRGYFLEYNENPNLHQNWLRSSLSPQVNEIIIELGSNSHWICTSYSEFSQPNYKWYNINEILPSDILEGFYKGESADPNYEKPTTYNDNAVDTIDMFGYTSEQSITPLHMYLAIDYLWNLRLRYNEDDYQLLDPYFEFWKADSSFENNRMFMYNGDFAPLDKDFDGDPDGFSFNSRNKIDYTSIHEEFYSVTQRVSGSYESVIIGYYDTDGVYHPFTGEMSENELENIRESGGILSPSDFWPKTDEDFLRENYPIREEDTTLKYETNRDVLGQNYIDEYFMDGTSEINSDYLDSTTGNRVLKNPSFKYIEITPREHWQNKLYQYFNRFTGCWWDGPKADQYQINVENDMFDNTKRHFFETGFYVYAMNNSEQFLELMNKDLFEYIKREIWFKDYDVELKKSIERTLQHFIKTFETYMVDRLGLSNLASLSNACVGFSGYKNLNDIIDFFKPYRVHFASFSLHMDLTNPLLSQVVVDDRLLVNQGNFSLDEWLSRQNRNIDKSGNTFPTGVIRDGDWYVNNKKYQQTAEPENPFYLQMGYAYDSTDAYLYNTNKYLSNLVPIPEIYKPRNYLTINTSIDRNDYMDGTNFMIGSNQDDSVYQYTYSLEETETGFEYERIPQRLYDIFQKIGVNFSFSESYLDLRDFDRSEFMLTNTLDTTGYEFLYDSTGINYIDNERCLNGNFSTWVDSSPEYWTLDTGGFGEGSSIVTQSNDTHSDDGMFSVYMKLEGDSYFGNAIYSLSINPQKNYILTGYSKRLSGYGHTIISVKSDNNKYWNNYTKEWSLTTNYEFLENELDSWKRFELNIIPEVGMNGITITLIASGSEYEILYDDISIVERYYESVFPAKNLINNYYLEKSIDYESYFNETRHLEYLDSTKGILERKDKFKIASNENFYEHTGDTSEVLDIGRVTDSGAVSIIIDGVLSDTINLIEV